MNVLHVGIKFDPWDGGAHIGALREPPDGYPGPPCTLLSSDALSIPVYLWWLDNELPDGATRLEIERVVRGYVERETHTRGRQGAPTPTTIPGVKELRDADEEK